MGSAELSVVCGSCGSEVSPYVTECPYCGTRLRKRAPRLEEQDGELRPRESRRDRRKRKAKERRAKRAERARASAPAVRADRPWVTIAAVALPAAYLVAQRTLGLNLLQAGGLVGDAGEQWWRFLSAAFVYDGIGYLVVCGLALALLLPSLEERLGSVATGLFVLATATLTMVAVQGVHDVAGGVPFAAGGNGLALGALAAVYVLRRDEEATPWGGGIDRIAFAVGAAVLVALAAVEDSASLSAAVAGGLVGLGAGYTAWRAGRGSEA